MECGVGSDHRIVGRAVCQVERQILELRRDRCTAGAAEGEFQRVGAADLETQAPAVLADAVERTAVGVHDRLGGEQYAFEQPIDVALVGQVGAYGIEFIQALEKIFHHIHDDSPASGRWMTPVSPSATQMPISAKTSLAPRKLSIAAGTPQ